MSIRFGDVIVVPFPFTDQSARTAPIVGEVAVVSWQAAGLLKPSVIKPLVTTIEARLVLRQLGALHADDVAALRKVLATSLGEQRRARSRLKSRSLMELRPCWWCFPVGSRRPSPPFTLPRGGSRSRGCRVSTANDRGSCSIVVPDPGLGLHFRAGH
jgi:mRNA interferase MazF